MRRRTTFALAGVAALLLGGLGWMWSAWIRSSSVILPDPLEPCHSTVRWPGFARDLTWGSGDAESHDVVLHGYVFGPSGRPFANSILFLVPAYVGSGPARIEAQTDDRGYFAFPRFILARFELVPRSLDDWRPRTPGSYLRIAQTPETWLSSAEACRDLDLHVESYTLVPVTLDLSALQSKYLQVWTTHRGVMDFGTSYPVGKDRVTLALEEGVPTEVWALPRNDDRWTRPSTLRGLRPLWSGTPQNPMTISPPQGNIDPMPAARRTSAGGQ